MEEPGQEIWRLSRSDFDASLQQIVLLPPGSEKECIICFLPLKELNATTEDGEAVIACPFPCHEEHLACRGCVAAHLNRQGNCFYCREEFCEAIGGNDLCIQPFSLMDMTDLPRPHLAHANLFAKRSKIDKRQIQLGDIEINRDYMVPRLLALLYLRIPYLQHAASARLCASRLSVELIMTLEQQNGKTITSENDALDGQSVLYRGQPTAQKLLESLLEQLDLVPGMSTWGNDKHSKLKMIKHYMMEKKLQMEGDDNNTSSENNIEQIPHPWDQTLYEQRNRGTGFTGGLHLTLDRFNVRFPNCRYFYSVASNIYDLCFPVELWVETIILLVNYFIYLGNELHNKNIARKPIHSKSY